MDLLYLVLGMVIGNILGVVVMAALASRGRGADDIPGRPREVEHSD